MWEESQLQTHHFDNRRSRMNTYPHDSPNADVTHATKPEASGYVDANSAVMSASGTDQIINMLKPKRANNGPPEQHLHIHRNLQVRVGKQYRMRG